MSSKRLAPAQSGDLRNNYLYQGSFSELDEDIGWTDFMLRSYDAQTGRFIQQDPYQQFASPYTGMGNDPVNMIDPSGGSIVNYFESAVLNHLADAVIGGIVGGIIGGGAGFKEGMNGVLQGAGVGLSAGMLNFNALGNILSGITSAAQADRAINGALQARQVGGNSSPINPKSSIWDIKEKDGEYHINATVVVEVHIKLLDEANSESSKEFAEKLINNSRLFSNIIAHMYEDIHLDFLPNGKDIRDKHGKMPVVKIKGLVPLKIKFVKVESESELKDTDYVLMLTNKTIRGRTGDAHGISRGNVAAVSSFDFHTAYHEVFHILGLNDEYDYETLVPTIRGNIMANDGGYGFSNRQAAVLLRNSIRDIGIKKAGRFFDFLNKGTKSDLNALKNKLK